MYSKTKHARVAVRGRTDYRAREHSNRGVCRTRRGTRLSVAAGAKMEPPFCVSGAISTGPLHALVRAIEDVQGVTNLHAFIYYTFLELQLRYFSSAARCSWRRRKDAGCTYATAPAKR